MSDVKRLPQHLQDRSLSDDQIILGYEDAFEALKHFLTLGYVVLGYELLKLDDDGSLVTMKDFISDYPDQFQWEELCEVTHTQVKEDIERRDFSTLILPIEPEFTYYGLTFATQEEFFDYYYRYEKAD